MTLAFPLTSAAEGGIRDPGSCRRFLLRVRACGGREAVNTDIVSEFAPSPRRRNESGQEAIESRGTPGMCVSDARASERARERERQRERERERDRENERARERERPVRVGSRYVEPP